MNLNSCKTRRLNIKSSFNRRCLWRCCRCCLNCFLPLGLRAPACTFYHLFVCLPSFCLRVCLFCTLLSKDFSAVHSAVTVCAGDRTSASFLNAHLSFEMLKIFESRSFHACNQIIKESPQRWKFSLALKQNETKRQKQILHANIHATRVEFRGRTGYNV